MKLTLKNIVCILACAFFLGSTGCDRFKVNPLHFNGKNQPAVEQELPQVDYVNCKVDDCSSRLHLPGIDSTESFSLFATKSHSLGVIGDSVKFFVDRRSSDVATIYYMNGQYKKNGESPSYSQLHYDFGKFALSIPEEIADYNQVTYFENDKRYFAGKVQLYDVNGKKTFGVQFFPQDVIHEDTIIQALKFVKSSFRSEGIPMAFVGTGEQQTTNSIKERAASLGFDLMTVGEILGSLKFLPLHIGETYGYLRVFPKDQDSLRPTDIVVFNELPLDLTVVGGVISRAYQDSNSHVNLKSKERNSPNMVLRDAGPLHPEIAPLIDQPVKLVVGLAGYEITKSTKAEVEKHLKARTNKPWKVLSSTIEQRFMSYDDMCSGLPATCLDQAPSYGGKAAGLGFLANPGVLGRKDQFGTMSESFGYNLSPKGFGVPLIYYDATVAGNPKLAEVLKVFIDKEKAGKLSSAERRKYVLQIQELFLNTPLPEGMLDEMYAQLSNILPGIKAVKVRSSANAEDIPGFNGAGLYNSYRAKTKVHEDSNCAIRQALSKWGAVRQKVWPKTLACAIKASYASLWNLRAIDERSFARIDHKSAKMGLAIVPVYDHDEKINANSVVITRVLGTDTLAGYGLSVQQFNNLVTNPAPPTYGEQSLALFLGSNSPTSLTVKRYAKPTVRSGELTAPVLQMAENEVMVEIAKRVEESYCNARPDYYLQSEGYGRCDYVYYDENKPKALDMEFKLLANGQFICKQVREFNGGK